MSCQDESPGFPGPALSAAVAGNSADWPVLVSVSPHSVAILARRAPESQDLHSRATAQPGTPLPIFGHAPSRGRDS